MRAFSRAPLPRAREVSPPSTSITVLVMNPLVASIAIGSPRVSHVQLRAAGERLHRIGTDGKRKGP